MSSFPSTLSSSLVSGRNCSDVTADILVENKFEAVMSRSGAAYYVSKNIIKSSKLNSDLC